MTSRILGYLVALSLAVSLHFGVAQAAPLPANPDLAASDQGLVRTVQHWRQHHHHGHGHHHHWRPRHHHHHFGWGHHHHWRPRHHHHGHWGHHHHHGHWGHHHHFRRHHHHHHF